MKTIDNSEDQDLQDFFSEMKAKDSAIEAPQFPKIRKFKSWSLIPIGIAASLILMAWFYTRDKPIQTLDHDLIIITLEEGQNNELQFKIESTTELESWDSPTSSLLTDF
ncbi:hypothetical protein [Cyclobacterium plantarum]|uniref:Uncharacterized protein n=1 Tax=Cyclobacterium plantarum TaxID=2716263 RepID=A0ABX0HAJ0_9BACT|nr:hypothetical protein [Cyclobacterium plantarum]NHE57241.1 hypothetical protein [Cyclobacterium plantarum]